MRYRWLRYRYAKALGGIGPDPLGNLWGTRLSMILAQPQWRPPVDLYETDSTLIVKVEAAGMSEEEFDVTLYEDTLVIEGERPWRLSPEETRLHVVEVRYGPFRVEVPMRTAIDRERVSARYEQGFLYVVLPKGGE
jgi:HSP20 family protein